MKRVKIALIGCGKISKKHIEALSQNEKKFELVAVCDENISKLNKIKINVKKFKNIKSLISSKIDFDLATITTPSGYHKSHAISILKSKKNVLVEKPMSLNFRDCKKMIISAKKNKKKIFVCLQSRFNPIIKKLKKVIEQKKLGKIYHVDSRIFWHRPQKYYNQDLWRGTKKLDGGVLMNQAIHFIDLLTWLFGPLEKKQVLRAKLERKIETEDCAVLNLFFKKKIICSLSASMLTNNENYEGSITIIGKKGIIKIGGTALNRIVDWNIKGNEMNEKIKNNLHHNINKIYGSGHKSIYDEIYKFYNKKKNKIIFGNEGSQSIKLIDSLYKKNKLLHG